MKEKNDEVINVRLPAGMKEQLKQKLGYNMSKIMKKHFQALLDEYDYEKRNKCILCKESKAYDECSWSANVCDIDNKLTLFIFCNECMKETMDDYQQVPEVLFIKAMKQRAADNKSKMTLKKIGNDVSSYPEHYELGAGTITFKIPKSLETENEKDDNTYKHTNSHPTELT